MTAKILIQDVIDTMIDTKTKSYKTENELNRWTFLLVICKTFLLILGSFRLSISGKLFLFYRLVDFPLFHLKQYQAYSAP